MTLAELRERVASRASDAEAMHATAPVADVLGVILSELADLEDVGPSIGPVRLLAPSEAAELMGVTVRWLYDHTKTLPFARRLSRKCLRYEEPGLRRWLARRGAGNARVA